MRLFCRLIRLGLYMLLFNFNLLENFNQLVASDGSICKDWSRGCSMSTLKQADWLAWHQRCISRIQAFIKERTIFRDCQCVVMRTWSNRFQSWPKRVYKWRSITAAYNKEITGFAMSPLMKIASKPKLATNRKSWLCCEVLLSNWSGKHHQKTFRPS